MATPDQKKLLIFYIYNILKEHSDDQHPLTQQKIIDLMEQTYNMTCGRKAVSDNVYLLENELNFDIITVHGKGIYLGQRNFEESEVSFLVDAIFSSRDISSNHAQKLAKKVFADFSVHQKKRYTYIYKSNQLTRADNKQLFLVIDKLGEAIEKKCKVSLDYITYSVEGQKRNRKIVSPHYLINNNGKYYLVSTLRHETELWLKNYRVDRIENVEILTEKVDRIENAVECNGSFDITTYAKENIYLFGGTTVRADILLRNESALAYLYDWFGKDIKPQKHPEGITVSVRVNEKALIYWLLQYSEVAQLLAPEETLTKMKAAVENLKKMYDVR